MCFEECQTVSEQTTDFAVDSAENRCWRNTSMEMDCACLQCLSNKYVSPDSQTGSLAPLQSYQVAVPQSCDCSG